MKNNNLLNPKKVTTNIKEIVKKIKELEHPIVLSVGNQKGGVGKTATSDNLAEEFAKFGLKTGLIDMDPQSSITNLKIDLWDFINKQNQDMSDVMNGEANLDDIIIEMKENLFLFPTTLRLSNAELQIVNATLRELILDKSIKSLKTELDIIIIDCPPSRGLLTVNALSASDFVLIPVQSEYQALMSIELFFNSINNVQRQINTKLRPLGYVITMQTDTNHSDEIVQQIEADERTEVISKIKRGIAVSDAGVAGVSAYEFDPRSTAGIQYKELSKTALKKIYESIKVR